MKSRILKITTILAIMLVMLAAIPATAFAAEGELEINSTATVNVGDRITYTLNLSDCEVPIIGLQMYLSYDSSKLQYVEDSLKFEKIDGVVSNPNLDNLVILSWTDISNEADFSKKAVLLTISFDVIDSGESEISYYISHMYGDDMGYIKNYTITYDLTSNDKDVITDQPAVVTSDDEFVAEHQGSFINYDDSMGDNSPNKDSHEVVDSTLVVTSVVDVTRYESADTSQDSTSGTTDLTTALIIIAIVIVVLAIVAVIIVKKRDDAKKQPKE
jgi:hypothetical protein